MKKMSQIVVKWFRPKCHTIFIFLNFLGSDRDIQKKRKEIQSELQQGVMAIGDKIGQSWACGLEYLNWNSKSQAISVEIYFLVAG
jgi:hypothetical protein